MPYLPDNRQFKRRQQRVHVEAPVIHLSVHSGQVLMWLGVALLLSAGMIYLGRMVYLLDQDNTDGDQEKVESVVAEMQQKISQVESERDALSQSVATLERAAQVDQLAQREVQEELIELQDERHKLEQEMSILKRVTGKSKGSVSTNSKKKSTRKKRTKKKNSKSLKINKKLPTSGDKKAKF